MPLPFLLGAIPVALKGVAVTAGVVGAAKGVEGVKKMKEAKDTVESAERCHKRNQEKLDEKNKEVTADMDRLGELELEIISSFEKFSDFIEKIKNRPEFASYSINGVKLPKYDREKLKEVSIGASVLLGGIGGAGAGLAGGIAAGGATTAAVMAVGTASTGTAISSLSGVAATNAVYAVLGGGTLAAGGGGVALGTAALGAATFGIGLLAGGIIFSIAGSKIDDQADEAWFQMKEAEKKINRMCEYFDELSDIANKYYYSLDQVNSIYREHLHGLEVIVNNNDDWDNFSKDEKLITKNTVDLVALLNKMCRVQIVLKSEKEDELNKINYDEINKSMDEQAQVLVTLSNEIG